MPKRTGVTSLTDAELLLLDFAALHRASFNFYLDENFEIFTNGFEHGLDDETVMRTLDQWERNPWIVSEATINRAGHPDREIRMTPAGGEIWESERRPDWSRFIRALYGCFRRNDLREKLIILGHSPSICRDYFEAGLECYHDEPTGHLIEKKLFGRLVLWRKPEPVYLMAISVRNKHCNRNPPRPDYKRFEALRTWWRFFYEIESVKDLAEG